MSTDFEFSDQPRFIWIYHFDVQGVFFGTQHYFLPAHSGLPANSTHIPYQPETGMIGIWDGEQWQAVTDLRGQRYWNDRGTPFMVLELIDALPDWAITVAPPMPAPGHVVIFNEGAWLERADLTGSPYYSADGQAHRVPDAWFMLPADCTFTPPGTPFDSWNGTEWVTDTQAQADAALQDIARQHQLVVDQAQQQRQTLLEMADQQIRYLEDAIELGMQQDGDAERFTAWKKFRVLVVRIDPEAAPDIDWPVMP